MAETPADRRQCPTRPSGPIPLIAHWITLGTCAAVSRAMVKVRPTSAAFEVE